MYLATEESSERQVAIKVIELNQSMRKQAIKFLNNEVSALERCEGHNNVIKLYGHSADARINLPDGSRKSVACIV